MEAEAATAGVGTAEDVVAAAAVERLGAGISMRRAYVADAIVNPGALDLIEIVAEHYFSPAPRLNDQLAALAARFTVVPHGLDLSLGSAGGVSKNHVRKLRELVECSAAPYWSEHIAFTRAGGRSLGHLAPLPFTREALDALFFNIARVREEIGVPLILENIASPFDMPRAEMDEAEFLTRLIERTACGLLLDVANLYYNARNRGCDPFKVLERYPLHAVVQCHLAGGHRIGAEWVDSHAFRVPPEIWELFEVVARRAPVQAVIIERDENLPPFAELADEVARAREVLRRVAA